MSIDITLILIGAGIGTLVGFTGTGGGSLTTPILVLMGMPPSVAVGTDLVYAAVTKSAGAVVHLRRKTANWETVKWLATGSVPAALITTLIVAYMARTATSLTAGLITHGLAVVLVIVAVSILLKPWLRNRVRALHPHHRRTVAIATGFVVGTLVALTSIGGGSLTMIALIILLPTVSTMELVGTDIVHAAMLSLVAASARLIITPPDLHVASLLLIGSVPAVVLSSRLTVKVPDTFLRFGLAGTLLFVGARML